MCQALDGEITCKNSCLMPMWYIKLDGRTCFLLIAIYFRNTYPLANWTFLPHSNVFSNYTWNKQGGPYTKYGNGLIPSRIPLSALVQGPLVGGHWQDGDPTPRSVVKEFWDEICPEFGRVVIDPREVDGNELGNIQASILVDKWLQKLSTIKSRCVEIDRDSLQMFSFWYLCLPRLVFCVWCPDYLIHRTFGNGQRLLDVWPSYSTSPIITQFRWSSLIETAFQYNHRLFTHSLSSVHPYNTVPGLLALHIRRGDYQDHCEHLAKYGSIFNGFNSFPELQDQFVVPETDNEAIKRRIYMKSCLPTFEEIIEKIVEVKRSEEGRGLRDIYIMTNGPQDWVTELKDILRKSGEWGRIASSRDLTLSWEQKYVGQAVDMLIGQRAQVMIGNGVSGS